MQLTLLVQMRAEYERLGRKQLEANVENLVRSKVSFSSVLLLRLISTDSIRPS